MHSRSRAFVILGGLCAFVLAVWYRQASAMSPTEERPVMQVQSDLPVAYLLSRGGLEATLGYAVANDTLDPVNVGGRPLEGGLAPGTANAGYPQGVAGRKVRVTVGTGPSLNLYADVGREKFNFAIAGLKLDTQHYGFRYNFFGERNSRPAVTLDYSYHMTSQPKPLEMDGHRVALVASKSMGRHFILHGTIGVHKDDVTAEFPTGPAPQLGLIIPSFNYPQGVLETGLALTWTGGTKTDLTVALDHRNFDRAIDDFVPGGGIGFNDRFLVHLAHAASESLVVSVRLERHSHGLSATHPQLYNFSSVDSFTEPFGFVGFGLTWRGDLSRR